MKKKAATVENVLAALPAVQATVRREIAARIAAGEDIASSDPVPVRKRRMIERRKSAA